MLNVFSSYSNCVLALWYKITNVDRRRTDGVYYCMMTEVTSTPARPVDNVVITTKGLQDRNIHILDGTTVENKVKLILTQIFPSVQKHYI